MHQRAVSMNRPSKFDRFLRDMLAARAIDGRAYHFCRA
jgi:hypothetical protein